MYNIYIYICIIYIYTHIYTLYIYYTYIIHICIYTYIDSLNPLWSLFLILFNKYNYDHTCLLPSPSLRTAGTAWVVPRGAPRAPRASRVSRAAECLAGDWWIWWIWWLRHGNVTGTGWWFGCHQFYFPINIGLLIIPIDSYFSEGWPWPSNQGIWGFPIHGASPKSS